MSDEFDLDVMGSEGEEGEGRKHRDGEESEGPSEADLMDGEGNEFDDLGGNFEEEDTEE